MEDTARTEHLNWCKTRALEYVERGDLEQALTSMASDLGKHEEIANHAGIPLGLQMMMAGLLNSQDEMRRFINGFH